MMIDRKVLFIVVGATFLSLGIIAITSYGAAQNEYYFSEWSKRVHVLPLIVQSYKDCYRWVWLLPLGSLAVGIFALCKNARSVFFLAVYVGVFLVISVLWICFTLLAFYFSNQSFVG